MFHCVNCDVSMCKKTQTLHAKSKASKNHTTVSLISHEMYQINQTGNKCPSHTEEDLLMYCNTCVYPICRQCIVSGVHLNHPMVRVEEVIDMKQQQLSNIIRQKKTISSKYVDVLKTITRNKLQLSESTTKTIKEVKAKKNQLKIKLDKIESEYIQQLEDQDKKNKEAMEKLEQKIKEEMSYLNELIQQCESKQKERTIEIVQLVTDVMQRVDKYTPNEQPDEISPPNLVTRDVADQELKDLFGHLDMKTKPEVDQSLQMKIYDPSTIPDIDFKIISSFTSEKNHVVIESYGQAWLWSIFERGISLVTSDGKVMQNINTNLDVFDATVSTSGDLFVTENGGNTVKKITRDNRITHIYKTRDGYVTKGITVTDTGNVLVILFKNKGSKIVEITTSGQHIKTIQHDPIDNKQLFDQPRFVCVNLNGDIIVTDNGKVVAVNK
ncbi:hypothetical protein KUTeg_011430 [Tegillarca granosa]|uniref:B box-type domain-containing protein n=1 Tax=Tegillarca granosa TaxID=220873 RepID=A0ABQ9F0N4_TEGGR|nr:hypothetical protein KUTeg_011430 [Tegillarca granosa]